MRSVSLELQFNHRVEDLPFLFLACSFVSECQLLRYRVFLLHG